MSSRVVRLVTAVVATAGLAGAIASGASAQTLGQLTPLNCFSTTAVTGCTSQPGLDSESGQALHLEVSPDGRSVYAVTSMDTLVQFAIGADGSLAYVTCIGDATLAGANPCPVAAPGITQGGGGTGNLGFSPDGAHLYVAGFASNTVAVFRRDTDGATLGHLTSEGCLANTGVTTCDAVPGTTHGQAPGLDGPLDVAVSPDGANLYVPAISSKTVAVLKRDIGGPAAGRLTSDGCLAHTGTTTCNAVPGSTHAQAPGLEFPDAAAVSPDGATVYVTDALSAIAVLTRDVGGATPGRLTTDGCLANVGSTKCDSVSGSTNGQAPGIQNPQRPVVSADGLNVYVSGQATLAAFKRDGSGATPGRLTSDGCLASPGSGFCDAVAGNTKGTALAATGGGIAISSDGANVYTPDLAGSRIGVFKRDAAGGLSFDGCLADTGNTSCDAVAGATHGQAPGIFRPRHVAVAPSGSALYAVSASPGSAVAFARFVPPPPVPPGLPVLAPAFGGVSVRGKTVLINARGRGAITVGCPALAQGACAGRGVIRSAAKIRLPASASGRARKRIRRLATFRFSAIQAGTSKKVRFKLTKKARRLLFRKRRLRSVVSVSAHDSRNVDSATRKTMTLRARRKR